MDERKKYTGQVFMSSIIDNSRMLSFLQEVLNSIADLPPHLLSSLSLSHVHATDGSEGVQSDFCVAMLNLLLTVIGVTGKKE